LQGRLVIENRLTFSGMKLMNEGILDFAPRAILDLDGGILENSRIGKLNISGNIILLDSFINRGEMYNWMEYNGNVVKIDGTFIQSEDGIYLVRCNEDTLCAKLEVSNLVNISGQIQVVRLAQESLDASSTIIQSATGM